MPCARTFGGTAAVLDISRCGPQLATQDITSVALGQPWAAGTVLQMEKLSLGQT